jgi:transposase-like protein
MGATNVKTGAGSAEARWRAVVDAQRASGMTVKAFCAARGIAASSLFAWRRRLASAISPSTTEPTFVEVSTPACSSPPCSSPHPSSASIELELRAGGRRVLILRRGFDPALLRDALAALEAEATITRGEATR